MASPQALAPVALLILSSLCGLSSAAIPGTVTVKSLKYPEGGDGGNAELLLDYSDEVYDPASYLLQMDGETLQYEFQQCDASMNCTITGFSRSSDFYNISVVAYDDKNAEVSSADTTFQDLNVNGAYSNPLVNFYVLNTYEGMNYTAAISSPDGTQLDSVNLACSTVSIGSPCIGFMNPGDAYDGTSTLYLQVNFANGSNTIIAPIVP